MTEDKKIISAYALYASDAKAEQAGTWVPVGPFKFKLARAGGANERFQKEAAKRFKPFQAAISNDTMPKEMAEDLVIEIFVDTIVLDWADVGDRDGVAIPFSKDAARKLFRDLPNLFEDLQKEAVKAGNFRKENLEAAAGN